MSRLNRLRPAGLLVASIGAVAAACGADTIDLLPLSGGASMALAGRGGSPQPSAGSGGMENAAGAAGGGAGGRGGMGGRATAGEGGNAGSFQNSGGRAGSSGCVGMGCGGTMSGYGGRNDPPCSDPSSPFCTSCTTNDDCPPDFNCAAYNYCRLACNTSPDCANDGICDTTTFTCSPCLSDTQCAADGMPKRLACEFGRCVECNERVECTRGICRGLQCLTCDDDKDCTAGKHCDKAVGRCF
jgi:hypothetical protein